MCVHAKPQKLGKNKPTKKLPPRVAYKNPPAVQYAYTTRFHSHFSGGDESVMRALQTQPLQHTAHICPRFRICIMCTHGIMRLR